MRNSGIYLLEFGSLYRYVGQALDIDARAQQHLDSLYKGKAAAKLRGAYNICGEPTISIIARCHPDHLDALEAYYINLYNDEYSLNTSKPEPSINFVTDALLENLKLSTEHICNDLDEYRRICLRYRDIVESYEDTVAQLREQRSKEELEADITKTISALQADNAALVDSLELANNYIKQVQSMPWYKRIFL